MPFILRVKSLPQYTPHRPVHLSNCYSIATLLVSVEIMLDGASKDCGPKQREFGQVAQGISISLAWIFSFMKNKKEEGSINCVVMANKARYGGQQAEECTFRPRISVDKFVSSINLSGGSGILRFAKRNKSLGFGQNHWGEHDGVGFVWGFGLQYYSMVRDSTPVWIRSLIRDGFGCFGRV